MHEKRFVRRTWGDWIPRVVFVLALMLLSLGYGYWAHRSGSFPHAWVVKAEEGWRMVRQDLGSERPWYQQPTDRNERMRVYQADSRQPGLTLIAGIDGRHRQFAEVIDEAGETIHHWDLDWFTLWPDADHLDDDIRPKSPPGAVVHGFLLMENGDLIFNYEVLGMVRLDLDGNVVWRLPRQTHHSLHLDGQGHIWTSIRYTHEERQEGHSGYEGGYFEYTVVEISADDGEVLQEFSVFDLLQENNLHGLLYLATGLGEGMSMFGDTLHLNDVELFPADMEPGFFEPGDFMISLRQTNAVVVFHLPTRELKYLSIGPYVRQHDPDFIDGNTISIYDNNHVGTREEGVQSRVILERAPDRTVTVAFSGNEHEPFFSDVLGKHQWLENGNLLVLEATAGRLLEVDPQGLPVADFVNLVEDGVRSILSEGMRLPAHFDRAFFER